MLMESASHMAHHDNLRGHLHLPVLRITMNCPCLHHDYFYETGSRTLAQRRYYFADPLWDGEGVEGENECCNRGGPWFCKQLPQPTQDDIAMKVLEQIEVTSSKSTNHNQEYILLSQSCVYLCIV